jgi:hypothetical protein
MIFDEKIETLPLAELKNLQSERLKNLVQYIYKNCAVYKQKIDQHGVSVAEIKTIDDFYDFLAAVGSSDYPFHDTPGFGARHDFLGHDVAPVDVGLGQNLAEARAGVVHAHED